MATRYGTCHFVSRELAKYYYRYEGATMEDIERKIDEGLIRIGQPKLRPGQRLMVIDDGTRYGIEEVLTPQEIDDMTVLGQHYKGQ